MTESSELKEKPVLIRLFLRELLLRIRHDSGNQMTMTQCVNFAVKMLRLELNTIAIELENGSRPIPPSS